jgi:serine/threonine protein kinase
MLALHPSSKEHSLAIRASAAGPSISHLFVDSGTDPELARLLDRMVHAWEHGFQLQAEVLLNEHPDLWDQPERGLELVYEEICQRQQAGLPVDRIQFTSRFSRWTREIQLLFDCHQVLGDPSVPPVYPGAGEQIGEFQLVCELGQGARGRVWLATQSFLADRHVVLKLVPSDGQEHLSLARLQHTHIVPLYSIFEDRSRNLRALCMPFLGGASLDKILLALRATPRSLNGEREVTGSAWLLALDSLSSASNGKVADQCMARGPVRRVIGELSHTQTVCWLGACLADALAYAHDRGLVHLDIKPSNVLLTADGKPMLLDFHLAHEPIEAEGAPPGWLGGTPGYMSPEQEQAVFAVQSRQPVLHPLDGRSDIYSLATVLYEALAGDTPDRAPPPLRSWTRQVSPGLADIIGRGLAREPGRRYQNAQAFAADLKRHLEDLPLLSVRNRSWTESWQKWRRRRPHALRLTSLALLGGAAIVTAAATTLWHVREHSEQARLALQESRLQISARQFEAAAQSCRRGLAAAQPFIDGDLVASLNKQVRIADQGQAMDDLHGLVCRLRYLYGAADVPASTRSQIDYACRRLWKQRMRLVSRARDSGIVASLQPLEEDLADLAILWADLRVRFALPHERTAVHEEAISLLDQAHELCPGNPVLVWDRSRYRDAISTVALSTSTNVCAARASGLGERELPQARTAWEHYALGRSLLRDGDMLRASQSFQHAVALEPTGLWPNFYEGLCAYDQGRYDDAALAFTVCLPAARDPSTCLYNRALALAALGKLPRARQDLDACLRCKEAWAAAWLERGKLDYRLKMYAEAERDFREALSRGVDPSQVQSWLGRLKPAPRRGNSALFAGDSAR